MFTQKLKLYLFSLSGADGREHPREYQSYPYTTSYIFTSAWSFSVILITKMNHFEMNELMRKFVFKKINVRETSNDKIRKLDKRK